MEYSGAGGKLIHEKNQKQKISWHCPFKEWIEFTCQEFFEREGLSELIVLYSLAMRWKNQGKPSVSDLRKTYFFTKCMLLSKLCYSHKSNFNTHTQKG
jgi:hypothetical protein